MTLIKTRQRNLRCALCIYQIRQKYCTGYKQRCKDIKTCFCKERGWRNSEIQRITKYIEKIFSIDEWKPQISSIVGEVKNGK